jgi:hypothetical protein
LEGRSGRLKGLKMFSFWETVPMLASNIVVTEDSAVLSISHSAPIAATHSDIVKFFGKSDVAYKKVVGQFREWTKNAVRADKVNKEDKTENPDQFDNWPGDDDQRRKKKNTNSVSALGARIRTISNTSGGTMDFRVTATGGDSFDLSHATGRVIGKVIYQRGADDVSD